MNRRTPRGLLPLLAALPTLLAAGCLDAGPAGHAEHGLADAGSEPVPAAWLPPSSLPPRSAAGRLSAGFPIRLPLGACSDAQESYLLAADALRDELWVGARCEAQPWVWLLDPDGRISPRSPGALSVGLDQGIRWLVDRPALASGGGLWLAGTRPGPTPGRDRIALLRVGRPGGPAVSLLQPELGLPEGAGSSASAAATSPDGTLWLTGVVWERGVAQCALWSFAPSVGAAVLRPGFPRLGCGLEPSPDGLWRFGSLQVAPDGERVWLLVRGDREQDRKLVGFSATTGEVALRLTGWWPLRGDQGWVGGVLAGSEGLLLPFGQAHRSPWARALAPAAGPRHPTWFWSWPEREDPAWVDYAGEVRAAAQDGAGALWLTGATGPQGNHHFALWRLSRDGLLAPGFPVVRHDDGGGDGYDLGTRVTLDGQGRVWVAGSSAAEAGTRAFLLWRFE